MAEFMVRYTTLHERKVEADDLQAAAARAKKACDNVQGARLVAVYDPTIITKPDVQLA